MVFLNPFPEKHFQFLIQIGNSLGIIIPSSLRKSMKLRKGSSIEVSNTSSDEVALLRKATKKVGKKETVDKEFQDWLDVFLKENGEILDELAVR